MGTRGGEQRARLRVLYDFEYETRGRRVRIVKDERLLLLRKTNEDWWQVARPADLLGSSSFYVPEQATFYVPTGYVAELIEEPLPESTRFYVDKDRMFRPAEQSSGSGTASSTSSTGSASSGQHQQNSAASGQEPKHEPRKAHESFRSVMKKLSGNLTSHSDGSKPAKPAKPPKAAKNPRKNSLDNGEEAKQPSGAKSILGLVPIKHKDHWEGSAFGMCFGRDTKNVDAQLLNPFQEELANKVILKKTILDNKVEVGNKHVDQAAREDTECSNFENIHSKWEKVSAQVLKKPDNSKRPDNFQFVSLAKIKEDAQKRRSASPNFQKNDGTASTNNEAKPPQSEKLYSVVEKGPKKPSPSPDKKLSSLNKPVDTIVPEKSNKPVDTTVPEKSTKPIDTSVKNNNIPVAQESPTKSDIDRLLINDKRKMWAIETLMSELMQSSANSKAVVSSDGNEKGISGPNQLAQELHDMDKSRRFENAEIQVNLLDNNDDSTKENEQPNAEANYKMNSWKRKVFDFPPRSSMVKAPKSPTARSPKLLDEYNEANILNDNERARGAQDPATISYDESPSYSNISLRIKRDKVPCKLKMPTKDFREELQLTPSLEKLASEIKFLPASSLNSAELDSDRQSLDLDCPTTTLSQDSLRLYKRRSKSDGALNKFTPGRQRRDSVCARRHPSCVSASHTDIFGPSLLAAERKYARCGLVGPGARHEPIREEEQPAPAVQQQQQQLERPRYSKLNRKSRSLGDLDCSDGMDEKKEDGASSSCEAEARRRYKPVPKLRSKESLRRLKLAATPHSPTASSEHLAGRPVPAKRRIQPQSQQSQQQSALDSSYDELSEIDIERSTAVGFKSLLRTSDSGSEEYLQYKTFPASSKAQPPPPQPHSTPKLASLHSISRSDGSVNLSRSISDEMILSSASCSSASPSRTRDSNSLENLVELPPGWTQTYDHNAKRVCFVSKRGDKWFSSNDAEGKIYFFEENSNESSWALPTVVNENHRVRTVSTGDWPQLFDGNMCILKEGAINKTKITTENGKKLRKTWSISYAVLTELFLLFFKDAKTFAAMKMDPSAAAKPDISIDLNGAFIESGEKLSNRKNVYLINTLLGLQVLVQSDNALVIAEWYREIHDAIQRLPFSQEYGRSSSSKE